MFLLFLPSFLPCSLSLVTQYGTDWSQHSAEVLEEGSGVPRKVLGTSWHRTISAHKQLAQLPGDTRVCQALCLHRGPKPRRPRTLWSLLKATVSVPSSHPGSSPGGLFHGLDGTPGRDFTGLLGPTVHNAPASLDSYGGQGRRTRM